MNNEKVRIAQQIIDQAIHEHEPSHIFAMFSGGYDSLASTVTTLEYVQKIYPALPVMPVHINTGIGIEETRQYVRELCASAHWGLLEYKTPPEVYDGLVAAYGFPGPASHMFMYINLKERRIYDLFREHTPQVGTRQEKTRRILLVTGARKHESVRRMGNVEPIQQEKSNKRRVWVAPLTDWHKDDVLDLRDRLGLPHNHVADTLHMSGECKCGGFATEGEYQETCLWYPAFQQRIERLSAIAQANGVPHVWGTRPPRFYQQVKQGQQMLDGFAPMCSSCAFRTQVD